jgi:hypothetical protein
MTTESHTVPGEKLVERVKGLIKEGNARRIIIKHEDGHTVMEIPLTIGVVGAVLVPLWVALGAIAALATSYTLIVEKRDGSVKGELPRT